MKNPFNVAPRCVQWAAVILIAVQIFSIVVSVQVAPLARYLPYGAALLASLGLQLALAGGLLFGMNLVRLLFAGLVLYGAAVDFFVWSHLGFSSMSLVSDLTPRIAPFLSLILVFLPAANRYFASKGKQEAVEEDAVTPESSQVGTIVRIAVLLLLLVVGIPLVKHFRPAFENATAMNSEQKVAYAQYQQDLQDLKIVENLRLLSQAQSQYFLDHRGTTAKFSDLVGSDRFISQLSLAAGEKYPDEFIEGKEPVAILPDSTIVYYDQKALKAKRIPPLRGMTRDEEKK